MRLVQVELVSSYVVVMFNKYYPKPRNKYDAAPSSNLVRKASQWHEEIHRTIGVGHPHRKEIDTHMRRLRAALSDATSKE